MATTMDVPGYFELSPWFPNPLICMWDMAVTGTREFFGRLPFNAGIEEWISDTWYWISRNHYKDPSLIVLPVLLAVSLTFLRLLLSKMIFKVLRSA